MVYQLWTNISIAMFDLLIQLKNNGTLKHMVRNGLMSPKVLQYLEIYMYVDARAKATKQSLNAIITDAEVQFGVCRRTIWNAIKAVKDISED